MEWGKIQHTSIDLLRNVSMRVLYFALSGGRREKKRVKVAETACETGTSRAPLQAPQGGKYVRWAPLYDIAISYTMILIFLDSLHT